MVRCGGGGGGGGGGGVWGRGGENTNKQANRDRVAPKVARTTVRLCGLRLREEGACVCVCVRRARGGAQPHLQPSARTQDERDCQPPPTLQTDRPFQTAGSVWDLSPVKSDEASAQIQNLLAGRR